MTKFSKFYKNKEYLQELVLITLQEHCGALANTPIDSQTWGEMKSDRNRRSLIGTGSLLLPVCILGQILSCQC